MPKFAGRWQTGAVFQLNFSMKKFLLRVARLQAGARALARFNFRSDGMRKMAGPLELWNVMRRERRAPLALDECRRVARASIICLVTAAASAAFAFSPDTMVWLAKPAKIFLESTPLGNGRLGAMEFGGRAKKFPACACAAVARWGWPGRMAS